MCPEEIEMELCLKMSSPLKRQYHKMFKHTQTTRQQIAEELFECVWPFCGIGA